MKEDDAYFSELKTYGRNFIQIALATVSIVLASVAFLTWLLDKD